MKKNSMPLLDNYRPGLLAVVLLLLTTFVQGQIVWQPYPQKAQFKYLRADSFLLAPADTLLSAPDRSIALVNGTLYRKTGGIWGAISGVGGGITDGDKGDITVASSGASLTIDNLAVTNAKINSVAWSKITSTPTTLSGYGILDAQPLDGDLSAIAILTTNGFAKRTGTNTWAISSTVNASSELSGAVPSANGGVPSGGSTGQLLTKNSGTSYDYSWTNPTSGIASIGTINSVSKVANGASISGSSLYMQTPDLSNNYPGLMTAADKRRLDSNFFLISPVGNIPILAYHNDSTASIAAIRGTGNISVSKTDTLITVAFTGALPTANAGVPSGGSTNQVLAKNSGTNYDYSWVTPAAGGSPNTSIGSAFKVAVNGTNNIKSLRAGSNVTLDSATTGEILINASGDTTIANVLDYGAIPNDGIQDGTAFKAAIATGKRVYVPPIGNFFINDTLILAAKQVMFGGGPRSVLYTTEDSVNIIHLSDSSVVHDLAFQGTGESTIPGGTFTLQNGIYYGGSGNTIYNCSFSDIAGSAIYSYALSTITGNSVHDCIVRRSTVGVFLLLNSEYGTYDNIRVYDGNIAFFERNSGNNKWSNLTSEFNDVGFRLYSSSGGNGGHGQVIGSTFNHQTSYGIEVQAEDKTYLFANNQIWNNGTGVVIGSVDTARNVIFENNVMSGGSITTTKAKNSVWTGGAFGPGGVTVSGTTGIEFCHIMNSVYQTVGCGTSSGMTNPMTTTNDLIKGGTSGAPTRLAAGSDGQFLQYTTAGGIAWASITGGGDVSKVGTPVNNQVGVWTGSGTLEGDANFTWDGSTLTVTGAASVSGTATLPSILGGTAVGSGVTIKATTATGTATAAALTVTGNVNGGTTLFRVNNDGMAALGPNAPLTNARLFITGSTSNSSAYTIFLRNLNSDNLLYQDNTGSTWIGNSQNSSSVHTFNGSMILGGTNTSITNTVSYNKVQQHITSGTAAAGFGVGTQTKLENGSGTNVTVADESIVYTDVTNASEDVDKVWRLIVNGSLTERMRLRSTGALQVGGTPDVTTADSLLAIENGDIKKVGTNTLFSSAQYTPTLTNGTNVTSSGVNTNDFMYIRVGNMVFVSGVISLTQTAALTGTELGISLPIPSNFTNANQCSGNLTNQGAESGGNVIADATNDRAKVQWYPAGTTPYTQYVSFMYLVQ